MAKGYWVSSYKKIINDKDFMAYAKLSQKTVAERGGRFLVRGGEVRAFQDGIVERTVIVEFNSFDEAVSAYGCTTYKEALRFLEDAAIRDFRIVEGVR